MVKPRKFCPLISLCKRVTICYKDKTINILVTVSKLNVTRTVGIKADCNHPFCDKRILERKKTNNAKDNECLVINLLKSLLRRLKNIGMVSEKLYRNILRPSTKNGWPSFCLQAIRSQLKCQNTGKATI